MKFILLNISLLLLSLSTYSQTNITPADLKKVIGNWEGSITYLDYKSNKPYTMPANLMVTQGKNEKSLKLQNIYPNEPKANSTDKIRIAKQGTVLNKSRISSRETLENGNLQIQTEHTAKDDNKKALIRYTYIIGQDLFIIRKEVQFESAANWIKRSEFNYQRKKQSPPGQDLGIQ